MKIKSVLVAILLLWATGLVRAQITVQVQKADLAIPFGSASGKIVTVGDYLVFLDEDKPDKSFAIAKSEIENLTGENGVITVETRHPIRDRSGEQSQVSFRLADRTAVAALINWSGKTATVTARAPANPDQANKPVRDPQGSRSGERSSVTIPVDTVFRLRLNQGFSSRTAQKGDKFTANVTNPVVVGETVVVPEGSIVHGRVTEVTPAERRKNATLAVEFYELEVGSQQAFPIYGSLTRLEDERGQKREVGPEGEVQGKSTAKRDVVFIGGGAGAGALIGGLAGGGKGAGIGAAVGAGLGTLGALFSEGSEVEVASGTEIAMVLDREVTVPMRR